MLHRQALVPNISLPPPELLHRHVNRHFKRAAVLLTLSASLALGLTAPAQAQQVTVDSIYAWGCNSDEFSFRTTRSGFSSGWDYSTLVEQNGRVLTDQGLSQGSLSNISTTLSLREWNDGRTTGTWPLASDTPFTVTLTSANTDTGELGYVTRVQVSQCNAGGVIQSNTTTAYSPSGSRLPQPVPGFTATFGDRQVTVRWQAPADVGSAPLSGYYLLYKAGSAAWRSAPGCTPADPTANSCTVTGLTNGVNHLFRIRAANAHGTSVSQDAYATPQSHSPSHTITTTASPTEGGTVTCTPNPVPHGESATCTASPATGYSFMDFSGDCVGGICKLTNVTSSKAVTAIFKSNLPTINARAYPTEGGTVSCSPNPVPYGGSATCTASPAPGYFLARFSGDCGGSRCELTHVTTNKAVGAHFSRFTSLPAAERDILIALYNSTQGDSWNTKTLWKTGGDFSPPGTECAWYGVTCNASGDRVTGVSLSDNNLQGTLPNNLNRLTALKSIYLEKNGITGNIPELTGLADLEYFYISENRLSGPIPALTDLTALKGFRIDYNRLTGAAPQPPLSSSLSPAASSLCPNRLAPHSDASINAYWDTATGESPWHTNCTSASTAVRSFSGTTVPASGAGAPATASFTGGGATCSFDTTDTGFIAAPAAAPSGQTLPQGLFRFKLVNCDSSPVTMRVQWPEPVSAVIKYGKQTATASEGYFTPAAASASGNVTQIVLIDGVQNDNDWLANGTIVDPMGPVVGTPGGTTPGSNVTAVPTLGHWALLLLGLVTVGIGASRLRRASVLRA